MEIARRIVTSHRFKKLPSKFEVHEWSIMQAFASSVEPDRIHEELLDAIDGAGAFRHFVSALRRHRIESAWYAFRSQAPADRDRLVRGE